MNYCVAAGSLRNYMSNNILKLQFEINVNDKSKGKVFFF